MSPDVVIRGGTEASDVTGADAEGTGTTGPDATGSGATGSGATGSGTTGSSATGPGSRRSTVLPPAAPPVGVPAAALVSVLLCLALVGLGVLALREALVGRPVAGQVLVPGEAWLAPLLASASAVVPGPTAVLVGAVGTVVGLLLLVVVVRPRPRRTVQLVDPAGTGVPLELDSGAVADLAAEAALAEPGVRGARARARGRRVTVHVTVDGHDPVDPRDPRGPAPLASAVSGRVAQRLQDVQPAPRVRVRVRGATA